MEQIKYPGYQIKSFGKVVEITENRVQAHATYERLSGVSKELFLVQPNGAAHCLRRS